MKIVNLDEYRKAKLRYHNLREKHPNIGLPFKAFCVFRTRYEGYMKAMRVKEKKSSKYQNEAKK
jgi:hypothetical protein